VRAFPNQSPTQGVWKTFGAWVVFGSLDAAALLIEMFTSKWSIDAAPPLIEIWFIKTS
jgi:hypothetical protein